MKEGGRGIGRKTSARAESASCRFVAESPRFHGNTAESPRFHRNTAESPRAFIETPLNCSGFMEMPLNGSGGLRPPLMRAPDRNRLGRDPAARTRRISFRTPTPAGAVFRGNPSQFGLNPIYFVLGWALSESFRVRMGSIRVNPGPGKLEGGLNPSQYDSAWDQSESF